MGALILAALVLGLAGSLHCVGMCGPLVMSMPFRQANDEKLAVVFYQTGKAITYSLLGLVAGYIGKGFAFFQWQQALSIIAGTVLLLLTFLPYLKQKIQLLQPVQQAITRLFQLLEKRNNLHYFFLFGLMNGFLPCGLVYSALAAAMVTATPWHGMLFMFFFGIGTMPSLTAVIFFQHKVGISVRRYLFKSSYYIAILIGVLLILRGFNLGIPYISPHMNLTSQTMDCCHKH